MYMAFVPLATLIWRPSSVVSICVVLMSLHSVMLSRTGSWISRGLTSLLCLNAPHTAFMVERFFLQTVAQKCTSWSSWRMLNSPTGVLTGIPLSVLMRPLSQNCLP